MGVGSSVKFWVVYLCVLGYVVHRVIKSACYIELRQYECTVAPIRTPLGRVRQSGLVGYMGYQDPSSVNPS